MKIVLLPIEVPDGEYCWGVGACCEHFDNEGGWSRCMMGLDRKERLEYVSDLGVRKPSLCLELKTDERPKSA